MHPPSTDHPESEAEAEGQDPIGLVGGCESMETAIPTLSSPESLASTTEIRKDHMCQRETQNPSHD